MAPVVLLGTLDTKGAEYAYLRDRLRERGVDVLLVDAGICGPRRREPDIARDELARRPAPTSPHLPPRVTAAPQ